MMFPSDAVREWVAFELAYEELVADLLRIGKVPPSRDIVLEHSRRSTKDVRQVIAYWRATWKAPETL